ncbi:MAG: signal peptidase I [Christensenellaceae bacterium]|jgi:signal peptidase I|nr:signal peptidase I [Christensenellaceae bacterium]
MQKIKLCDVKVEKKKKENLDWYKVIVILIITFFCSLMFSTILNTSFNVMQIDGTSMANTLQHKDNVVVFKLGTYMRGDVIIFVSPDFVNNPYRKEYLVKRIIALPGDYIEVVRLGSKMVTYVNDEEVDESYLTIEDTAYKKGFAKYKLGEDEFFYMGDNRMDSYDSRAGNRFGTFSRSVIIGRVVLRYAIFRDENGKLKVDADAIDRIA